MHGKTLKDWQAKRAGGRITVTGTDVETGETTKLVGVDAITPAALIGTQKRFLSPPEKVILQAWVAAVDMHGVAHRLMVA